MKKTISTEKVLLAYRVLSTAKYSKLDDADKIKSWKIARAMKPVATQFEDDSKDAAEKLKPSDYDFDAMLQKAQEYEQMQRDPKADMTKAPMGPAEYADFIKKFQDYNKLVGDAVKEFADKKVEVDFEPLTEESFGKLMASNDWTVHQAMLLGEIIIE